METKWKGGVIHMKLIFCPKCQDMFKLQKHMRYCMCKKSYGKYNGLLDASIGGEAIPIGIANRSFAAALTFRPEDGLGEEFTAFVIPRKCRTINDI